MRNGKHTRLATVLMAAGLATGVAGLATAQDALKAKGSTTSSISVINDEGAYQIKIVDGEVTSVTVDGESVDPAKCVVDQEQGFIVIHDGDEARVVDIPRISTQGMSLNWSSPFGEHGDGEDLFFPGKAPDAIEWADQPEAPAAPRALRTRPAPAVAVSPFGEPRVMIGITHNEVDADKREKLELERGEGVQIVEVREGLPADEAGLKAGDVIVEIDGERLTDRGVLSEIVKKSEPGDRIRVVVLRENDEGDVEKKTLRVKLAEFDREKLGGGVAHIAPMPRLRPGGGDLNEFEFGEFFEPGEMEFEFEMPELDFWEEIEIPEEQLEALEPEVREEVRRALEMAREQAREARTQVFRQRGQEMQGQWRHFEDARRAHEDALRAHEDALHEHLRHMDEDHAKALQEHLRNHQQEMQDRMRGLELKLKEIGEGNERVIRVRPEGRAFIIEREDAMRGELAERADRVERESRERAIARVQERDVSERMERERDELRARNRELESRVDSLERKIEQLMRKLEEKERERD